MPAPAAREQLEFTSNHVDYLTRLAQWNKVRDCLEGEDAVKLEGRKYLPKPDGMGDDAYNAYKTRASFYGVAERTLRGLSGMVLRIDPVLELPSRLEPMRDCLTTEGYGFQNLVSEILRENLSIGRYGILLDFPVTAGITDPPYFATYFAPDIVDWDTDIIESKIILTRVLLRDQALDKAGVDEEHYRELCLLDGVYTQRVWAATVEKNPNASGGKREFVKKEETVPRVGGKPLSSIPFVFINPYDLRPEIEKPPFLDLCNVNLAHYRNSADYEHALFLTAQPTPWASGSFTEENKPTAIGSGAFWILPEDGKAGMLEFSGAGIAAQERALEKKEDRMAALGARMIYEGKVRNETAKTARMRGDGETSLLVSVVMSTEQALGKLFRMAAEWMGSSPDDVRVAINRDFVESRMEPAEIDSLVKAWQAGAISHETLHYNLQRGEIVPSDRDLDEELEFIDNEEDVDVPEAPTPETAGPAQEEIDRQAPGEEAEA